MAEYLRKEARVIVMNGAEFGPHGEGHIRINMAAAYPVLKCFNCGNLFYFKDIEEKLDWLGACPKCGSMKVCPPSMPGEQKREMFPEPPLAQ